MTAMICVALTAIGSQPVQAQADTFADLFKNQNGDDAQILERRGNEARDRRIDAKTPDARTRNARTPATTDFDGPEYRQHVGNLAANADLQSLEQRGYDARRARPRHQVRNEYDLTPRERRELQRRGRDAQVTRGTRPGYQADRTQYQHPHSADTNNLRTHAMSRTPRNPDFKGAEYRRHAGRLAANADLQQLEQRGYDARRARPGHQVRSEYDLTPNERRDLQQRGRQAQINRGARHGYRPVNSARSMRYQNPVTYGNHYPGAGRQPLRNPSSRPHSASRAFSGPKNGYSATSLSNKASAVDFGTEAFGGRSTGLGEYGLDMTYGQAKTFTNGGDPVIAADRATRNFGNNLVGAAHGVSQSIRDPRKIPRNMGRAVTGVANTGVSAAQYVGSTAIKTTRDGARFMTDPKYANKQVKYGAKKAAKTISNVGKSTCKGFSTLLGLNKKKCR
ncbi:MAG: hypothetical protein ABJO01_00085 [Parasphingorhabdus sp.]|uniref:hypothetical protein n=1 Tax=Parasphingorhabdus sp. TaxID=2709688 RepID=UPI00329990ED